jgi:hypothetical protein
VAIVPRTGTSYYVGFQEAGIDPALIEADRHMRSVLDRVAEGQFFKARPKGPATIAVVSGGSIPRVYPDGFRPAQRQAVPSVPTAHLE